jgi:hypothetical protein
MILPQTILSLLGCITTTYIAVRLLIKALYYVTLRWRLAQIPPNDKSLLTSCFCM